MTDLLSQKNSMRDYVKQRNSMSINKRIKFNANIIIFESRCQTTKKIFKELSQEHLTALPLLVEASKKVATA